MMSQGTKHHFSSMVSFEKTLADPSLSPLSKSLKQCRNPSLEPTSMILRVVSYCWITGLECSMSPSTHVRARADDVFSGS